MVLTLVAASLIVSPIFGGRTAEFVRLSSPLFLIAAAGTVPMALLRRRLAFRRLSMIDFATSVMRVGVAVAGDRRAGGRVARLRRHRGRADDDGAGVGQRAGATAAPAPAGRARGHELRPARRRSPRSAGSASATATTRSSAPGWARVQAGYYFRAYKLAVEYQKKISIVMGQVGLPLLARAGSEMTAMRGHMVRLIAILTFPLLAVLAITAPELVPWLFGAEWTPAVRADADPRGGRRLDAGHRRGRRRAHGLRAPAGAAGLRLRPLRRLRRRRAARHAAGAWPGWPPRPRSSTRPSWSSPTSSWCAARTRAGCATCGPTSEPAIVGSLGLVAVAVPVSLGLSAAGTPTLVQIVARRASPGSGPTRRRCGCGLPGRLRDVVVLVQRVLPSVPRRLARAIRWRSHREGRHPPARCPPGPAHLEVPRAVDLPARDRLGDRAPAGAPARQRRDRIGRDVRFGWPTSPEFHTGYLHLEASVPEAVIEIGDGAEINNNAYIKSEGAGIYIGAARCWARTCRSSTRTSTTCTPTGAGAGGRPWAPVASRRERLHRRRDQDPQGRDDRRGLGDRRRQRRDALDPGRRDRGRQPRSGRPRAARTPKTAQPPRADRLVADR